MRPWFTAWWTTFRFRGLALESLVALSLAFLVWLYTHSRAQNSIDHIQIPVQIQLVLPQRDLFALEVSGEAKVTASFSGPASRIREFRRNLQRGLVQVPVSLTIGDDRLNDTTFCEVVRVEPHQIPVPPGVLVDLAEETCTIPVSVHRLTERLLPVKFDYTGDVRVTQVKLEPSTVLVRGPKHLLEHASVLVTQPYALAVPGEETSEPYVRGQVNLATELEGRPLFTNPKTVSFRCKVQPKQRIYELSNVPVHFLAPASFPWRPRFASARSTTVSLKVLGPASEEPPPVQAFVDLTGGAFLRGRNLEPVRLQLPKDFVLVHNPPVVAFVLEELDRPNPTNQEDQGP